MVEVSLTARAVEDFEELPLTVKSRVLSVFERLHAWPEVSGAKPLRGRLRGWYRIRTGDWRILFFVRGETVLVDRIGHRDGFYEE